jgi:hypothetical protein
MPASIQFLFKSFELNLGKFSIPIPYWEAAILVILIFFLIVSVAQIRKEKVDWSFKGGIIGILIGFLLALTLEGFLITVGRTALTEFLGWKNPPKPIVQVLDSGRSKLIQVLGVQSQTPSTFQDTLQNVQGLNPADLKKVKNIICSP